MNWAVTSVPLSVVVRAVLALGADQPGSAAASAAAGSHASARDANFSTFYRRINKQFAILLVAVAIIFPFLPFADRRLVDVPRWC